MSRIDHFHLEIRPGEGGDDAAEFAAELAGSLAAYAQKAGLTVQPGPSRDRTLIHAISGPDVRPTLDWLCGTHRVQRVPATERSGRRHTSTATVALVATSGEAPIVVSDADVTMEVYRGSGPGGQHRNKTATAVRLRHHPTGIIVTSERSRSQAANLQTARAALESRLGELRTKRAKGRADQSRRDQILTEGQAASGQRSAKAFTHDHFRGQVRDHQTGKRYPLRDFSRGRMAK